MKARIGNNSSMPVGAPSCHSNRDRLEEAGSSKEISRTALHPPILQLIHTTKSWQLRDI